MASHLIRMANEIATSHQVASEDEATQLVSEHINKFWAPSMRQKLFEEVRRQPAAFNSLIQRSLRQVSCSKYNPVKPVFRDQHGTGG